METILTLKNQIAEGKTLSTEQLELFAKSGIPICEIFDLSSEDLAILGYLGFELYQKGEIDDALKMFQGLEAIGQSDGYISTAIGTILAQKNDFDGAIHYLGRALDSDPSDLNALINRAEVFLKMNRFEEAAVDLRHIIEIDPEGKDPIGARARILILVTHELARALRNDPDGEH